VNSERKLTLHLALCDRNHESLALINKKKRNSAVSLDDLGNYLSITGREYMVDVMSGGEASECHPKAARKATDSIQSQNFEDMTYEDMSKCLKHLKER